MKTAWLPTSLLVFCMGLAFSAEADTRKAPDEQQIRRQIVEESIAAYPGRCPCPYNVTRNGSSCGGRSAWSKKGGYAPICYENEVSREMVRERLARESRAVRPESPLH